MESNRESDKPVAVIGAGLVGTLQAISLARRGFKVLLFELKDDIRKSEAWVVGVLT